jgi:hypothetical protein
MFKEESVASTPWVLGDHIRLAGYEPGSQVVTTPQPGFLTLYWQGLKDSDLAYHTFIQILNARGEPVTQLNEPVIRDPKQYYSNRIGLVYQQHSFWLGPDAPSGIYLVRVGLFNPKTGQRLTITTEDDQPIGDQLILAPFYVAVDGNDPRRPDTSLKASFDKQIELLGYSLDHPLDHSAPINVKLYWQAIDAIDRDYTIFLQLLDAKNQIISQHDAQPLEGLFPTSRWQIGQVIITESTLPLNDELPAQNYRLVTGIYDLETGTRLPVFNANDQQLSGDMVTLTGIE